MTLEKRIEIPEGLNASLDGEMLSVSGAKGEVKKRFSHHKVSLAIDGNAIVVKTDSAKRADGAVVGTWVSHAKNMITGAKSGYEYKLKIVYSHFPMTLKQAGDVIEIKNYLGGKAVRYAKVIGEAQVKIDKEFVVVSGVDKDAVGQTAANIEQATRVKDKDIRVFQDGVYRVEKRVLEE